MQKNQNFHPQKTHGGIYMPNRKNLVTFSEAINQAMILEAKRDRDVIFFAQGLTDPTAVFGTLKDLTKNISENRLIEMPTSENGSLGIAIGAAISGIKPIVSFHRVEFALLALEQIINNAAKTSFLSEGKLKVPLVIRLIVGRGWGQGPNHSQSLETIFSQIPGLKVIAPTFPKDAKGMFVSAIRDNNPVIIIEHRWCHYLKDNVKASNYLNPLIGSKVVKRGQHFTVVCVSYMVIEALIAANYLSKIGIFIEVIDLRVLRPLKIDKIFNSIKKTKYLMTVDLGWTSFGVGAEILASIFCKENINLKKPPIRLGMADKPTPSSRGLVKDHYPNSEKIIIEIGKTLNINKSKINKVLNLLKENLSPIDVPNNIFKGPF